MEIVHETWMPVVGHEEKFEVSSLGRVKALPWQLQHWCGKAIPQPEKIIKQSRHSGGYFVVSLRDKKKHFVHRLVMEAFAGPPPAEQNDVNHINGDKADNRLENLEYCDRKHNVHHAIRTGLQNNAGEGNGMHKYKATQIITAYEMVARGGTIASAARATGVSRGMIEMVVSGKRWTHLGLVKKEPAA